LGPSERVRILLAIPNFSGGGAERIALTLAQALDPRRFQVTVFAHERWGRLAGSLPPHVLALSKNEAYHRHQLPGLLMRTVALARQNDVLVGANEGRAAFLTLLAGRLTGRPVVCWIHSYWEEFGKHLSWRQRAALPVYARADALVAVSSGAAESFARIVGIPQRRLKVIHNGVPGEEIRTRSFEAIPLEHEPAFDRPTIVTAGRLDPVKGQEHLVRAHAALRARGVEHHLVLLGEGPRHEELVALAQDLGVDRSVFFLGFQENPWRYMRRATVFALSSLVEGMGLVLAEAMFCDAPVVSFDCPTGPREVLEGGRSGVLVPLLDTEGLATALERVLVDPGERLRLTAAGARRRDAFDLGGFASEWGSLLERIGRRAA